MPRPTQYSPARRLMMQGILWLILGATVGLAALVSQHRRSATMVKLGNPVTFRDVTVQLPKDWDVKTTSDDQSSLVLTATEKKKEDDEEQTGARIVRIAREPLASYQSPIEFAISRLHPGAPNSRIVQGQDFIPIAGSPGEVLYQLRDMPPTSLQELMRGGHKRVTTICAATVAPSGRGISIELDAGGDPSASDMDLLKRIAATVKLADEPPLVDSGEVKLDNGVRVPIPSEFSAPRQDDPLNMRQVFRSTSPSGPMRSILLLPIVSLPKDGSATLLTMLSLSTSNFADAQVRPDASGGYRADVDQALRQLLPLRAYSISKNGAGIIAIFRGGDDDSWIDGTWDEIRGKIAFPDKTDVDALVKNGAEVAKKLSQDGISSLLPANTDDLWWMLCVHGPERAFGWSNYIPGASSGKFDNKVQYDSQLQETIYNWRGPADLKTYTVKSAFDISDIRDKESPRKDSRGFAATYKAGKIELRPAGAGKPITCTGPPNFIPGGWLPLIVPKIVDKPMILRTDSFIDYAYAQPRDLLTITLRPEPDALRSTDDSQTRMRCISVQVSGAVEKSRWFFRADGTLDGVDYPESQHLIRSDEHEIATTFAHKESLRP